MLSTVDRGEQRNSVGIIGCGWLGKPLAQLLIKRKIPVLATSSKLENIEQLKKQGINAQQLMLPAIEDELVQHSVFTQESLVIAITPQFRRGRVDYANKIAQLVKAAHKIGIVKRIILLSSTAVYEGLDGVVNEKSTLNFSTEKVQILNAAEQAVLNFSKQDVKQKSTKYNTKQNKQGIVLRLAGLVGPERHPGNFLLANKTLSHSGAPVNLIHQQDAVGIIELLLTSGFSSEIFNGVSGTHVTKKHYYQVAAKALGLSGPVIANANTSATNITKVVSGDKVHQVLGYQFVYLDLLLWLTS